MDFAQARRNMVESQLRTNKITDEALLDAMRTLPRETFLPKSKQHLAYVDEDVPVLDGRHLTEPMILARMIQALDLQPSDSVLVIGGGVGYTPALLGKLAGSVIAIDSSADVVAHSGRAMSGLSCDNVVVLEAPMENGWPKEGPFDAILINGAVAQIPESLFDQLADGGRLATVERPDGSVGAIVVITRRDGYNARAVICDAATPYLTGFEPKPAFAF
ncbi:MAG: protein-L-isoaspartate O-methyltransferase [Alphaproteobacteria bacterium]|nr:protein-L-isoaspartate O-methyltransferase [Alphaproteobacteria bacterium]